MDEIISWLAALGLSEYAPAFIENRIDASVLAALTDQDLKDLGVTKIGDRRRLTIAIAGRSSAAASAEATTVAAAPPTAAPSTAAERRHLTVIFCDLVGSTALAARLDPEDMREVVRAYQGACAQVIERYEGFVAQYLGDGIMAYFGYPQAHEDDAERAVRAGLDLIAATGALEDRRLPAGFSSGAEAPAESWRSVKVQVRVGIATGLVVVGDLIGEHAAQERAVTGETPNLAARLQGLAAPGSIVVAATTRRLLGGMFDLRDLGPQQVKGLDAPIQAFAVAGARSFESRFEARAGGITGFVGREEECEHLLDRWKLARQSRGQAVLVSGEAGIGKSRLTAWLVDKVGGEPHTRMRYQCTPHHKDSSLYPTIAQIERAAGIAANEPDETKLAKLEALLAPAETAAAETVSLFAALLAVPTGDKYPPLAMSPGQQRQRTMAALLDQVEALARHKPLLMVYEDAHWADATSLELLDSLVDRLARLPVLFVVTGRPEFAPTWAGRHNVSTVTLQKLDKRHTRTMVESITGGATLPADVLEQIVAKTDGVPLFVEELTKTVLESGALVEDGGRLMATGALPIPATLQDSLMARLDRSNPVKEIAQIGAAIGREFSYKLLLAVAGMDEATLSAGLAKLEEAELANRRGVAPDATYTFKHALVQDAAYESRLKSRRQIIHRRIAKALRDQFPLLAETEPEIIAHHFTQARSFRQAIEWWAVAGERAARRSAHIEGAAHYERAIWLSDQMPDEPAQMRSRYGLQLAYSNVMIAVHGYAAPTTIAAFARCNGFAEHTSDIVERLASFYGLWVGQIAGGCAKQANQLIESESTKLGADLGGAVSVVVGRMLGASRWYTGAYTSALAPLRQAMAAYDEDRDRILTFRFGQDQYATIMMYLSFVHWPMGDIGAAMHWREDSLKKVTKIDHVPSKTFIHGCMSILDAARNDAKQTFYNTSMTLNLSQDFGLLHWNRFRVLHCWARWRQGTLDDRDEMHEAIRVDHEQEARFGQPLFDALHADFVADIDPQMAVVVIDRALGATVVSGQAWFDAELHRRRGQFLTLCGNVRAAEQALLEAVSVARTQKTRTFELRAALDLARLYCDTGREREAVPLLQGALVGFTETPEFPEIGEAQRLLASLS